MTTTKFDLWQTEREAAEVRPSGVKVLKTDSPVVVRDGAQRIPSHRWYFKVWMPRATKPVGNYVFRTEAQRDEYARTYVGNIERNLQARAEERARDAAEATEGMANVNVGTIFVHSWGYDQTNVDFYEVVRKTGSYVDVRPIASSEVDGTQGQMSASVVAVPGAFITKTYKLQDAQGSYKTSLRKRVSFYSGSPHLSFEYGSCSVWDGRPMYSSWYA